MSESTLSLTYNDLAAMVGVVFSFGPTVGSFSAAEAEQVAVAIRRGLRQFYTPPKLDGETTSHEWSFLHPSTVLVSNASYSTGTVTIVDGVVTLAVGTFPSWAAQGLLSISGTLYEVSTRDSGSQVTLVDTTLDASAGTTYALYQGDVTAPDAFDGFDDPPTYVTPSGRDVPLLIVDESAIRALRGTSGQQTGRPCYIAVRTAGIVTTGQRNEFLFWPAFDAAYAISYTYRYLPDQPTTTQYPLGGSAHAETILASCLDIAAQMVADQEQHQRHRAEFMERLTASVMHDRQRRTADKVLSRREMPDDNDSLLASRRGHYTASGSYG